MRKILQFIICLNIGYWAGWWTHKEWIKQPVSSCEWKQIENAKKGEIKILDWSKKNEDR